MVVIYLDTYFALNFCMDGILLGMLAVVTGEKISVWRFLGAAAFGAAGGCALLFAALPFWLRALLGYGGIGLGMNRICFPWLPAGALFKNTLLTALLAAALSGVLNGFYYSLASKDAMQVLRQQTGRIHPAGMILLSLGAAAALFIGSLLYRRKKQLTDHVYPVCLEFWGRQIQMKALYDTGNRLCTGAGSPVAIIDKGYLYERMPELRQAVEAAARGESCGEKPFFLQMLPFESIGGNGLLPVVKGQRLLIYVLREKGREGQMCVRTVEEPMLGLSDKALSKQGYQMILHQQMLGAKTIE